jgi:hypothetical protein
MFAAYSSEIKSVKIKRQWFSRCITMKSAGTKQPMHGFEIAVMELSA